MATMPLTIEEEEVDDESDYQSLVNAIAEAFQRDRGVYGYVITNRALRALYNRYEDDEWDAILESDSPRAFVKALVDNGHDVIICGDCETPTWRRLSEEIYFFGEEKILCGTCAEQYYWCDQCDQYDDHEHEHDNESGCDCEAPQRTFTFPNGTDTVKNDTRFTVTLPSGSISGTGIEEIAHAVHGAGHYSLYTPILGMDSTWQTAEGNFTTRLKRMAYKDYQVKLSEDLVSQIGNIASRHTLKESEFHLEFTRDLNLPATEFVNEGSCWWGDYSNSMCAFKAGGGIGLRAFRGTEAIARAWVLPLNDKLEPYPTDRPENARALFVFNAYGEFDNYTAAQIIAQMTGQTYKGVQAYIDPMYINGERGVVVADKETCELVAGLGINLSIRSHAY